MINCFKCQASILLKEKFMAKTVKRMISMLLAVVLIVSTFAGCGKNEKNEPPITATLVSFNKSGQYTTTVSSKKVDLSGITAENVEVRYADPTVLLNAENALTEDALTEEVTEAASEATAETDAQAAKSVKIEDIYTLCAKVDSVKAGEKKCYEITFTDESVAPYTAPAHYIVYFKGVEGESNTADVNVEFPDITLTPDVDYVLSNATEAKITLSINGGEFEHGISQEDIFVGDSFEKMNVESFSASGNNLTMQLKGELEKNELGIYQWGTIGVKPSGIKNAFEDVVAKVNIQTEDAYVDRTTLKLENGKISADLKVYGVADVNTLTKDNVKIEAATVEAAEKVDDSTVKLTIAADGINSVNDFTDKFGKNEITIGDYKTTLGLSQASFYPVFDYVEEDGDNLKLTLKLYAISGSFDKKFKADDISFADDFETAKAESVKAESDTLATVILSVPANGQTAETLKLNGTVELAAGAMTNDWGEKTSAKLINTRDYSGETLGRDVTLNPETLLEIQKYTRGLNTVFGTICYYGQAAASVYSLAKSVLEFTGVIKSDHEEIMDRFDDLEKKLDTVISNQKDIMELITNLDIKEAQNSNSAYETALAVLDQNLDIHLALIDKGALYMAKDKAIAQGIAKEEDFPNLKGLTGDALQQAKDVYRAYLPDVDSMTEAEAGEYNIELYDYIWSKYLASQQSSKTDTEFKNFNITYERITDALSTVTAELKKTGNQNPMAKYDYICSLTYNFDSQSYDYRLSQRLVAQVLMAKALGIIGFNEKVAAYTDDPTFASYKANVAKAINNIETINASVDKETNYLRVSGISAEEVKANPHTERVKTTGSSNSNIEYISDVKLCGMKGTGSVAKETLQNEGYTVIDFDLNKGTGWGTHYIYLGYKKTNDINEAIRGFVISDTLKTRTETTVKRTVVGGSRGISRNIELKTEVFGMEYNDCKFDLCPVSGDDAFVSSNGDLNKGKSGSTDLYLYYTRDAKFSEDDAVTKIYFDPVSKGSIAKIDGANGDFNQGAGGNDIFMHTDLDNPDKTTITVEDDSAYYPYCYALGRKIAYHKSADILDYRWLTGALKTSSSTYANWSDDQVSNFLKRMHYSSVKEELASAGIIAENGLLTAINRCEISQSGEKSIVQIAGTIINPDSKEKSEFLNYMTFDGNGKPVKSGVLNTWIIKGEFTFFELF